MLFVEKKLRISIQMNGINRAWIVEERFLSTWQKVCLFFFSHRHGYFRKSLGNGRPDLPTLSLSLTAAASGVSSGSRLRPS